MRFVWFFLFLVSVTSNAAPLQGPSAVTKAANCSLSPKGVSFLPAEETLRNLNQPLALLSAMVEVTINSHRCSGSFISDTGHILLASHCLESCDEQASLTSKTSSAARDITCDVSINGKKTRAHVEFKSRCHRDADLGVQLAKASKKEIPPLYAKCGAGSDLAVIRADATPENFKCLTLATNLSAPGASVFTLSRPMATFRTRDDQNSDGSSLYASTGKVIQSRECFDKGSSPNFIARILGEKTEVPSAKDMGPGSDFFAQRFLQTTTDALPGSSGAPLLNTSGEITGVIARVDNHTTATRECSGSTYAEPITRLADTAHSWNPDYDLSKLSCTRARAIPSKTTSL